MVKSKEQAASGSIDLSEKDWDSLSNPMKSFLRQQGITEASFQKKKSTADEEPKPTKRRIKLGEHSHRPVAEQPTETDEEGNPAIDSGATTRELSHHQANMEEGDPGIHESDPDAEEAESAEEIEERRRSEFYHRYIGGGKNPATGRGFTEEEKLLIYQKYQEINPNINDVLDVNPDHAHTELRRELENLISSEDDPDRKEYLEEMLDAFTDGGKPSVAIGEDRLRELFWGLRADLKGYAEDVENPTRKARFEGIIELCFDYGMGKADILGDVEDVIEEELGRETNEDRKKQLQELLDGLHDKVAIGSAERFARGQASRVAYGYEVEFINWMKRIVEAQGARGTKEMREKHQVGGMMVAYDTYGVLNYLAGGLSKSASPAGGENGASTGAESESETEAEIESAPLPRVGSPDFAAAYKMMLENKTRAIDWGRVEAYSPYGREFHSYVIAQEMLRGISAIDESDRLVYNGKRRERDEWRAVLKGEKEPTERQLALYQGFEQVEMSKAFSKELQLAQKSLEDARNLATYDHLREEGRTIKRIRDAGEGELGPDEQAYRDHVRDVLARRAVISNIYEVALREVFHDVNTASDPSSGYVDLGEYEGNPDAFIKKRYSDGEALLARQKEIEAGAELTAEEMAEYEKAAQKFSDTDFIRYATRRTGEIKKELTQPPLIGLHRRVDAIKAKLPEGQTLDDLVARREGQQKYLLDLRERYRAGKGRTEKETAEIRAYHDKVASPLKYYEYLRGVVADRKKNHEMNVASSQRIVDLIERDQGSFSAAVFGEYPDRVATGRYEDEIKKNRVEFADFDNPSVLSEEVARFMDIFPTMSEDEIRQKLISDQEKSRKELQERIENSATKSETYLFRRYGHDIGILGVDVEDHPGKLETLQAMADNLSEHVESLFQRIEHLPKTREYNSGADNLLRLIVEKAEAEAALKYLEEMIKLIQQDEAEAADASRLQVSGSAEKLPEAA